MRHTPTKEAPHPAGDGVRRIYEFPNGYAASVVRFRMPSFTGRDMGYGSYTSNENEWEVGVCRDGSLVYDSGLTDDVIGHVQDGDELDALLDKIAALPRKEA